LALEIVLPFKIEHPQYLLAAIPLIILAIYLLKRKAAKFRSKLDEIQFEKQSRSLRRFLILSRTLLIILLLIALSSPFSTKERTITGDYSLTILSEESTSMQLFEEGLAEQVRGRVINSIPAKIEQIAYGNDSSIAEGLLNHMQGDDNIFLVTDGNTNGEKSLDDIILLAKSLNSTISLLEMSPIKDDTSLRLEGEPEILFGTDYTYYIDVQQVGSPRPYTVELYVDGELIYQTSGLGPASFEHTPQKLLLDGFHQIEARLVIQNDYFRENNQFFKVVRVYPKPDVLLVTLNEDSKYERLLQNIYTLAIRKSIPADLSQFGAIILDDIPGALLSPDIDKLSSYVSDGNGLLVSGGPNSYDRGGYKDSLLETLLPVVVGVAGKEESEQDINVVLVIDISGSSTFSFAGDKGSSKISIQKAQALDILGQLGDDVRVGAVAFDSNGYYLTTSLLPKFEQQGLNDSIVNIKADPKAGTVIYEGLDKADLLLREAKGSKNIILISDGIVSRGVSQSTLTKVISLANRGVRIYPVGIGEDTDVEFMKRLAYDGKGVFFQPKETQKLALLFKKDDSSQELAGNELLVLNSNDFITQNLELQGTISGFNQVAPKPTGRPLVITNRIYPVVTTWRFGLGRVVSIATSPDIWAGSLLSKKNSELLTRSLNWAIGDPSRVKEFDVKTTDTYINKGTDIVVISENPVSKEGMTFAKVGSKAYRARFVPKTAGFQDFFGGKAAVNYPEEYYAIGLNPKLPTLASITGGKTFTLANSSQLIDFVKETSKRRKTDFTYFRWPFIVASLIIFLIEILVRRIHENANR